MQREPPANGQGRKFFVHTFGCQMNLADSERMAGALEASGYECTTDPSAAEILIYNTCSIREKAENKVYSALGRQAKRKRDHFGDVKIVVAGCVAQQEGQALLRRVPEVDVVMGPQHANQIVSLVEQADAGQVSSVAPGPSPSSQSTSGAGPCYPHRCRQRAAAPLAPQGEAVQLSGHACPSAAPGGYSCTVGAGAPAHRDGAVSRHGGTLPLTAPRTVLAAYTCRGRCAETQVSRAGTACARRFLESRAEAQGPL